MTQTMQSIQMLKCPSCGEMTLHPKRKEMGYHVCVHCSTAKPVVGITTVEGSGDHTYNDIIIMDQDRARKIAQKQAELSGRVVHLEMLDLDVDETAVSQSVKEKVNNVLEDEETPFNTFDPNEEKQGIEGIDY
jgi:phosphoribosyl-AMP cyclohydrolase|tara:strand:- start:1198 stop:1596 length:399 start_codon:yes stop_codon:yes gene_type:complete